MSRRHRQRPQNPTPPQRPAHTADSPWTFTWRGEVYRLRPAQPDYSSITGGDIIDQVMGHSDSQAEMRLIVNTLMAAEPDQRTLAALREMPVEEFGRVVRAWFQASARVSPGESSSSST